MGIGDLRRVQRDRRRARAFGALEDSKSRAGSEQFESINVQELTVEKTVFFFTGIFLPAVQVAS